MTIGLPQELLLDALHAPPFVSAPVTSHDMPLAEPMDALAAEMANVSITPLSALPPCARPEHRLEPVADPSVGSSSPLWDGPAFELFGIFSGAGDPTMVSAFITYTVYE